MELKNVYFSYENEPVIEGLSLTLSGGRRIAVMGGSGKGKTTLLRLMLGLIAPDSGEVIMDAGERPSVVFQEDRLLSWFTAERNVEEVRREGSPSARELLRDMELEEAAGKLPKELSGGMQRRVAIARALAFRGDPLLLDEPFKGLDETLKAKVASYVACCAKGKTVIFITHDISELDFFENCQLLELGQNPQTE